MSPVLSPFISFLSVSVSSCQFLPVPKSLHFQVSSSISPSLTLCLSLSTNSFTENVRARPFDPFQTARTIGSSRLVLSPSFHSLVFFSFPLLSLFYYSLFSPSSYSTVSQLTVARSRRWTLCSCSTDINFLSISSSTIPLTPLIPLVYLLYTPLPPPPPNSS